MFVYKIMKPPTGCEFLMQLRLIASIAVGLFVMTSASLAADPFAAGETWVGSRTLRAKLEQEWYLKVTKRTGDSFEGEITIDYRGKNVYPVKGKAPADGDGAIQFESETVESFQQSFEGTVRGDEIRLTFKGKSSANTPVSGTATLEHKSLVGYRSRTAVSRTGKLATKDQAAQRYAARDAAEKSEKDTKEKVEAEAAKLTKAELTKACGENPLKTKEDYVRYWAYRRRLADLQPKENALGPILGALDSQDRQPISVEEARRRQNTAALFGSLGDLLGALDRDPVKTSADLAEEQRARFQRNGGTR
jgi:hypothetical protein